MRIVSAEKTPKGVHVDLTGAFFISPTITIVKPAPKPITGRLATHKEKKEKGIK